MAGLYIKAFSGIRPRIPESLLSEREATIARNCDFAYGELRHTKDGYSLATLTNQAQSLYTDDGLTFFSWTSVINAVRSPIVKDTFNRLYYTGDGAMKVTNRLSTRANGGTPSSSYQVGVPRPTKAPTVVVPEIPQATPANANMVFTFHYESAGIKYQESRTGTLVTLFSSTTTTKIFEVKQLSNTQYQFTIPDKLASTSTTTGTPSTAVPVIRVTANWKDTGALAFDIYSDNSSFHESGGLYTLSMQQDSTGGTYTATLVAGIQEADKETRAYIYTYVNTYNEEGPPSDPTVVTTSLEVGAVVTAFKDPLGSYAPLKEIRVYRTPTGSTIADYFYVGSITPSGSAALTFEDKVLAEQLNEPLSSLNYYPPDPGLRGLMLLPNGILCAWKDNELYFSEAYKPWAWPPGYAKPLEHPVVAGIVHGSGAVITTKGRPYLVSGVSPDSMTTTKMNVDQAGVSQRSIAVVDGVVIYASNDGLVSVSGGSATLTPSQKFFTRDVWRQRYAAGLFDMAFGVWDGRLVGFSPSAAFTPFMIRTDEADGTLTDLPNFAAKCAFTNVMSDQMYYANGNAIYQFNGGAAQTAEWQSRELVIERPVNFGAAQAMVEGNWTIEFWAYQRQANGSQQHELKHTQVVASGLNNFRLPAGYESDRYRIKISGAGRFRELRVAQTFRELSTL